MRIEPTNLETLQKLMDAAVLRQQAVGQNLANVNTPGYRRLEVDFERQLSSALREGRGAEIPDLHPQVREAADPSQRPDGNNVDVDREMGLLFKNSTMYQLYSQVLASKIRAMHSAIRGQP